MVFHGFMMVSPSSHRLAKVHWASTRPCLGWKWCVTTLRNGFDASSDETDDINSVSVPHEYNNLMLLAVAPCLRAGFLRAIQIILKLKPGGCVTAGPPCGSFVFINLGTSGRRTWRPFGFTDRVYVSAANKSRPQWVS